MDEIRTAGAHAYRSGLGERNCPYVDDSENVLEVGYWNTGAGRRQRWMSAFLQEAQRRESSLRRTYYER